MAASHTLQQNTGDSFVHISKASEMLDKHVQTVRQYIKSGDLRYETRLNAQNRPTFYVRLEDILSKLPPQKLKRYLKGATGNSTAIVSIAPPLPQPKSFEQFSHNERLKINFWASLLEEWQQHRLKREGLPKAEVDEKFVAYASIAYESEYQQLFGRDKFDLTRSTLYRRWRSQRDNDLDGLLDKRGKVAKGKSGIPKLVWEIFMSFYLDLRQYPVSKCYEYTTLYIKKKAPEIRDDIPSAASFYRRISRDVPIPLKVLGREGEKAYNDRCAPYNKRYIDDMPSDEWWVADCHTLDIISDAGDGKTHRLYLIAFFDPRSYTFVGCRLVDQISSQEVIATLGKCIRKRQTHPINLLTDNGREFLTFDFGGLGFRARKKQKDEFQPPTILQRMNVYMRNALPRNGQAKMVERAFLDVKNQVSRLFESFTGGNVTERPENLNYHLKKGKVVADQELTQAIETLLDWYFNQQPYGGAVVKDRGKPRMQVYEENQQEQRVIPEADLNLMLMRSSRKQTINKRGVWLKIGDEQFEFFNDVTQNALFGHEVYYRYDPEDLRSVRIYDLEDNLLTVAPMDEEMRLQYGDSKEKIEAAMRKKSGFKKGVRQMLENSMIPEGERVEALELVMTLAKKNEAEAATKPKKLVKTLRLEQVQETALYDQAVGGYVTDKMLYNAEINFGGGTENE